MKKIFLSLVVLFSVSFMNAQEFSGDFVNEDIDIKWEKNFEKAVKKAKKEHKPILVYFTGSDWCGPCKRLDKNLFHTEKFKEFSEENLVLYTADFPRNTDLVSNENKKTNKQLSSRYNQESFPTMIMIDENGNMLGRKNGSYMIEYYYPFFESITKNYN